MVEEKSSTSVWNGFWKSSAQPQDKARGYSPIKDHIKTFILFSLLRDVRHNTFACFIFYLEGTTATMRSLDDCTPVKTLWSVNNLIKVYPNDVHCTANKEIYKNSFHNGHASARLQTLVLLLTSFHRQIGYSMMQWFNSIDVAAHPLVPLSASSVLDRESWIRASTCNRA